MTGESNGAQKPGHDRPSIEVERRLARGQQLGATRAQIDTRTRVEPQMQLARELVQARQRGLAVALVALWILTVRETTEQEPAVVAPAERQRDFEFAFRLVETFGFIKERHAAVHSIAILRQELRPSSEAGPHFLAVFVQANAGSQCERTIKACLGKRVHDRRVLGSVVATERQSASGLGPDAGR